MQKYACRYPSLVEDSTTLINKYNEKNFRQSSVIRRQNQIYGRISFKNEKID
jgi:hypothetical protein